MCLHADIERVQSPPSAAASSAVKSSLAKPRPSSRACAHSAAASTRWRLSCERATEAATSLRGAYRTHAIGRVERQHGTQAQRIAPKDARHRVIYHEQRACLAAARPRARKIGHTQTKPANGLTNHHRCGLGIKRAGKATGRRSKHLDRRLPHHHNIAAVKSARKRIRKVVRKGHRRSPGHNPQHSAAGTCGAATDAPHARWPPMPLLAAVRSYGTVPSKAKTHDADVSRIVNFGCSKRRWAIVRLDVERVVGHARTRGVTVTP